MNRIVHLAKFRAPGGPVAELVPAARYKKSQVFDD